MGKLRILKDLKLSILVKKLSLSSRFQYLIPLIFLLFSFRQSVASTYYISSNGNDNYSSIEAQSSATPWKSISKLNTVSLNAGDVVLFKRGEIFTGQVNVISGVTYDAYGTGNAPIIKGSVNVTNWQLFKGNIYVSSVNQVVKNLFVNSTQMTLARFPNSGFLYTDLNNLNIGFTDADLNQGINWQGANLRIATTNYLYETRRIATYTAGIVTTASSLTYTLSGKLAYYVDNKLEALDAEGEWYYDSLNYRLFLYAPGGVDPSTLNVEASVYNYGFKADVNSQNVAIQNLQIEKQVLDGITLPGNSSTNNSITNNKIYFSGKTGICVAGSNIIVSNNIVQDVNGKGIDGSNLTSSSIRSNTLNRIGLVPGYGVSGFNGAIGICVLPGNQTTISYNTIDSTGYCGIRCDGRNCLVDKNVISYPLITLTDGGGIYTWGAQSTNNIISNNFVFYPLGFDNGKPGGIVAGIYLDNYANYITVKKNTIVGSKSKGILVNAGNQNNTIVNNTCYGNLESQFFISDWIQNTPLSNQQIQNNIFYCIGRNSLAFDERDNFDRLISGSFDYNYYCNPYSSLIMKESKNGATPQLFTFEDWQKSFNRDVNSKKCFKSFDSCEVVAYTGNNLITNGTFDTDKSGWSYYNGSLSVINQNDGGLDGNALKFAVSTTSITNLGMAISPSFGITANQNYEASFSIKSNQSGIVEMIVRQNYSPYKVYYSKKFSFDSTRKDLKNVFISPVTDANARIDFQITFVDRVYWIDNIKLLPVSVSCDDPSFKSPLFTNPSDNSIPINLNGKTYRDLDGNIVTGSINLNPWSSKILVYERLPVATIINPTNQAEFTEGASIKIEAACSVNDGSISKVEFFVDQNKIGEDISLPYTLIWNDVPSGSYTLMVKATDSKGLSTTSSPVTVNVISKNIRFEAEKNYSTGSASASTSITNYNCPNLLSNGTGVTLFNKNDKIQIPFTVLSEGIYLIKARVRSGDASNNSGYANAYVFTVDSIAQPFNLDPSSISSFSNCLGKAYIGTEVSNNIVLNSGLHVLSVQTLAPWAAIDYIEINKVELIVQGTDPMSRLDNEIQPNIYPMPVKDQFTVTFNTSQTSLAQVAILDVNGKIMWQSVKQISPGSNEIEIRTNGISSGIYYLTIQSSTYHSTQKIVFLND